MTEPLSPETRAALEAAGPWQGWRAIESAPRDGTLIDLSVWDGTWQYRCPDARFYDDEWWWRYPAELKLMGKPTHWMPLPPPPASASPAPEGEAHACTSDDVSERVEQSDPLDMAAGLLGDNLRFTYSTRVSSESLAQLKLRHERARRILDLTVEAAEERIVGPIRSKIRDEVKRALRDPEVRAQLFSDDQPPE